MRQLSKNEQTESNFDERISSTPRSAQRVSSIVHALQPRAWKASTAAAISLSPGQPAELASIYVQLAGNDASGDYFPEVKSMPVAAKAIRAVPNQPNILRYNGKVNAPITLRRLANSIIKHITGAAVKPLMIAAHTKA
jgi:hypothetical protein